MAKTDRVKWFRSVGLAIIYYLFRALLRPLAISTLELYYMPTVHTFNMKRIDSLIKESDKELQQYIEALKRASDGWERLAKDAVAKLRQQTTAAAQNLPLDCQGVPADSGRGKLSGVR